MTIAPIYLHNLLNDDFSDGNISSDPAWYGDVGDFIVNTDSVLQLNASGSGTSFIYTKVNFTSQVEWSVNAEMPFSPSSSNRLRIYLMYDTLIDGRSQNGYFAEVGEDGSGDGLSLYVVEDGMEMLLAASTPVESKDGVALSLWVSLDSLGNWVAFNAVNGAISELFSLNDNTVDPAGCHYFGLECRYTSTRSDKFFFDGLLINEKIPDVDPPEVVSIQTPTETTMLVTFDEPIASMSGNSAFQILPDVGTPSSVSAVHSNVFDLSLPKPLEDGSLYSLEIHEVRDLSGNIIEDVIYPFTYYFIKTPGQYELIVNEIFADPIPSFGLPEFEFIELHNTSSNRLSADSTLLIVNSTEVYLPQKVIPPGEYLIICDEVARTEFESHGAVAGIANFPALPNEGGNISLINKNGSQIHHIRYNRSWHTSPGKDDGGWSIECINPKQACRTRDNWGSSTALAGGTPGRSNSILDTTYIDTSGPEFVYAIYLENMDGIELVFNENLADDPLPLVTSAPQVDSLTISVLNESLNVIFHQETISQDSFRVITVSNTRDCSGNRMDSFKVALGVPVLPGPGDIAINEVLYDPYPGGAPFIEFMNVSDKWIAANDLRILVRDEDQLDIAKPSANYIIPPGSITALTSDRINILETYPTHDSRRVVSADLSSFPSDTGLIRITGRNSEVLDSLAYGKGMHNALLSNTEGVSLERIDPRKLASVPSNWHSAAGSAGYATPGVENSQFMKFEATESRFSITNKVFSPDDDGEQDVLFVEFANPVPGTAANVCVYDIEGRLIDRLLDNETIGNGALASWDGATSGSTKAPVGIYILTIELIEPGGDVHLTKETVVLAARL